MKRLLTAALMLLMVNESHARPRRYAYTSPYQEFQQAYVAPIDEAKDPLEAVNALRISRGLRPFVLDRELAKAAKACANFRAANRIGGHTSNDFAFGGGATATGCACWQPSAGWGSCCVYDNYTHAGAGWAIGSDGMRYMHLFVR